MSSNDPKYVHNDSTWAQNGPKKAQMSLNEHKSAPVSLNKLKQA